MELISQSPIRVSTNTISDLFYATSGVRQGCPLSRLIFDIGMEPLAITLRKKLRGVEVGDSTLKVSMYADDTELFVKDYHDLSTGFEVVEEFENQSAMRVNKGKSSMLSLEKAKVPRGEHRIPRAKEDRYLGIRIGKQGKVTQPLADRYHEACNSWAAKGWDPLGKVSLVNAYCVGKIAYAAPFLTITAAKTTKMVSGYWNAIWSTRGNRMAAERAVASRTHGGIGALQLKLWLQTHMAVWVPWAKKGDKKWSVAWNSMESKFKPSKWGNVVQRANFYWDKFNLNIRSEKTWTARLIYDRVKVNPILKSSISASFSWDKVKGSMLRGKVQEVWWRWHHDKLKIQRVEGHRPECKKCLTKITSTHLVNECLEQEAISKLQKLGFKINASQWKKEVMIGAQLWLVVLVKFNIWKAYAKVVYGNGNPNPNWFLAAVNEWLDLGFTSRTSAKCVDQRKIIKNLAPLIKEKLKAL